MILLAIILPWFSFFMRGKLFSGIICLALQLTLIGWLPAAIWAVASRVNAKNADNLKKMEQRILNSNKNLKVVN